MLQRAGAYAARLLFNAVLLNFFFFMAQYLQGVSGDSPLQAGLAFLPVMAAAFAAAAVTPRLTRRLSNDLLAVAGCATMLTGTTWMSRVSVNTAYLTGTALPMIGFGIGQGFGLSSLTTAGMAGVAGENAGVAGGLVNVAHHLCGALGLGVLVTVFAAAGSGAGGPRDVLAQRVSASLNPPPRSSCWSSSSRSSSTPADRLRPLTTAPPCLADSPGQKPSNTTMLEV